ncbi:MAG: deoxyribose-phosphate aldolase [Christensenellales bacterium]|jgi:deoxyribose-phosphate aldolase
MDKKTVFVHVDHTLLKPTATWAQIQALCEEAIAYGMATVCVPACYVKPIADAYGNKLKVCTVVGFPLGYSTTAAKAFEAREAVQNGAAEVDMVINIGDAKAGLFDKITEEIRQIKAAVGEKVLKVIVETCYLTDDEKAALCRCVTDAGADFIKTSTGFGTAGATLADVELFKQHVGPGVRIKAAGGIRTAQDMEAYLAAGCARIGASAAIQAYEGRE